MSHWRFLKSSLVLAGALLLILLAACQPLRPAATPPNHGASPVAATPTPSNATAVAAAEAPSTVAATVSPSPAATPTPTEQNVARAGSITVSAGQDSAGKAIDGDPNTLWSAGASAPQTFLVTLDKPYLVDSVQLVVAQSPAGQTTHEIWLGDPSGSLTLYKKLVNTFASDGDTLTVPIDPPRVINRVLVRTDASPSFVAWREVRVFGKAPTPGASTATEGTPVPATVVQWPKIAVTGGFDLPVQVTNAGDGSDRMFVAERHGTIRVVHDGVSQKTPFLDISDRVLCCGSEQGLFDIAFPPDFKHKQYFYVSYTARPQAGKFGPIGDTVISRFHVTKDPNVADPKSEQVILVLPQPADAHNGGHLAFGPKDGYLYIGSGDGGLQNDPDNYAQSPKSLLGKILRIDTESGVTPYAIPPTNPFAHTTGDRPEIWALGFRNPWQFSFDSKTGDLYIADVGENNYEEVDFQPASSKGGENYGWHVMEGTQCHLSANCDVRGFTFPVTEYTHKQGCAIIGGTVYRGKSDPSMQGIYFYADLCEGRIWGLRHVGDRWESNLLADEPFQITDIGEDEQGDLYLTDYTDGAIMKIGEPPPE